LNKIHNIERGTIQLNDHQCIKTKTQFKFGNNTEVVNGNKFDATGIKMLPTV
jgi:hypothetical protein